LEVCDYSRLHVLLINSYVEHIIDIFAKHCVGHGSPQSPCEVLPCRHHSVQ